MRIGYFTSQTLIYGFLQVPSPENKYVPSLENSIEFIYALLDPIKYFIY